MQQPLEYYSFWISFCNIGSHKYKINDLDKAIEFLEKALIVQRHVVQEMY